MNERRKIETKPNQHGKHDAGKSGGENGGATEALRQEDQRDGRDAEAAESVADFEEQREAAGEAGGERSCRAGRVTPTGGKKRFEEHKDGKRETVAVVAHSGGGPPWLPAEGEGSHGQERCRETRQRKDRWNHAAAQQQKRPDSKKPARKSRGVAETAGIAAGKRQTSSVEEVELGTQLRVEVGDRTLAVEDAPGAIERDKNVVTEEVLARDTEGQQGDANQREADEGEEFETARSRSYPGGRRCGKIGNGTFANHRWRCKDILRLS